MPHAIDASRSAPADRRGHAFSFALRAAGALVMAAHGLVHLMGVALLWRLGQPGELTFEDTVPEPGTLLAYADGVAWALGAAVFVVAAGLFITGRTAWRSVAAGGVALSLLVVGLPLLAGSTQGGAGVVMNLLIGGAVVASWLRRRMVAR